MSSLMERQARSKEKGERIVKVARADPGIALDSLVERFGLPRHTIARVLKAAGIKLQPEGFAAYRNGTDRRRAG